MHRSSNWMVAMVLAAAVSLVAGMPAHAHVKFTQKNDKADDQENVLFQNAATGNSIVGVTNKSNLDVLFSSTSDTLVQGGKGQADVFAQDGTLDNLTISIPNGYYTHLIIDPQTILGKKGKTSGGTAGLSVITDDGNFTYSYELGNGENWLTIDATDGEKIFSTTIDMENSCAFADLKQPRITGAALNPPATPEPCSLAVLGAGVLPLLRFRRRARRA